MHSDECPFTREQAAQLAFLRAYVQWATFSELATDRQERERKFCELESQTICRHASKAEPPKAAEPGVVDDGMEERFITAWNKRFGYFPSDPQSAFAPAFARSEVAAATKGLREQVEALQWQLVAARRPLTEGERIDLANKAHGYRDEWVSHVVEILDAIRAAPDKGPGATGPTQS